MYAQHFGLTQDPFSIAPDPRYLFMSERHREALAHLLYGVSGRRGAAGGSGGGFVLLTGDIGTGKTTICRCFLEQLPPGCHLAYIFNPKLTVTELLQSICDEFHVALAAGSATRPSVKDYIDALNTFLLHSHASGQSCVLIIDEAQNLASEVLEQLRLLTNLETSERKLLQIVLIGQPELRAMLARPELEQLAQRIVARFHLSALGEAESAQYVAHRLAVAGHAGPLPFDAAALHRIYRVTLGVPRRINLLCGRALLGAWANGLQRVDRAVVDKAAAEVFGPGGAAAPGGTALPTSYALGALLLLVGATLAGYAVWNSQPDKPLPVARAPLPVPPPQAPASSAPPVAPAPVVQEIGPLLALMATESAQAWRELAPLWKLPVDEREPCRVASASQLQCYRASGLSLSLLRRLGQPGVLTLHADNNSLRYALLVGLTDQAATLQLAGKPHTVRLLALGRLWHGEFATYWRPPGGYVPNMRNGSSGAAIHRLASQLSQLDGMPAPAAGASQSLGPELKARVLAFQRAQGLTPDGQPGPLTFMQIDSALGGQPPRLLGELR